MNSCSEITNDFFNCKEAVRTCIETKQAWLSYNPSRNTNDKPRFRLTRICNYVESANSTGLIDLRC